MFDVDDLKELAIIIKKTGDEIKSSKPHILKNKSIHDWQTYNDILIENSLIKAIQTTYKNVNIISEENYSENKLIDDTFIIDPIDGTCNFADGIDIFGIQIAYFNNDNCLASFIYLPSKNEMYFAYKNKGCFLNGKQIFIDKAKKTNEGFLIISDYYDNIEISMQNQFNLVYNLQKYFLKTRHFGAACYDFSLLVKSSAIAYVTYYHKIWDIAPGLLLVKEAGGVYENINESNFNFSNKGIIFANNKENLELIKQEYKKIIS